MWKYKLVAFIFRNMQINDFVMPNFFFLVVSILSFREPKLLLFKFPFC